jgi:hypothetical protein
VIVVASLGLVACSGSGSDPAAAARTRATCAQLPALQTAGTRLAASDVREPDAFAAALTTAVDNYTAALGRIRAGLPESQRPKLDNLRRLVEARDFTQAVKARTFLDTWAARNCP